MLTYLLIFLCAFGVVAVFARRFYLTLIKKKAEPTVASEETTEGKTDDEKEPKKRISKDDKEEIEKLYKRAVAFNKNGKIEDAVKLLVQALALDPNFQDGLKELGKLYMDEKDWVKAAAVYKHLVELTNDPVDFSHLGLSLYNASEFDEAAKAYQAAITLDPERSQRYISLGQVYREAKKDSLALIAFNHAVQLEPENVEFLLLAADTNIDLQNFTDAKVVLQAAIKFNPMSKIARKLLKMVEDREKELNIPKDAAVSPHVEHVLGTAEESAEPKEETKKQD